MNYEYGITRRGELYRVGMNYKEATAWMRDSGSDGADGIFKVIRRQVGEWDMRGTFIGG